MSGRPRIRAGRGAALAFVLLAVCASALPARAEIADLTGLDARSRGMGMSTVTLCEDWTAAACNPAAGAFSDRVSVGFGYSYTHASLSINGVGDELIDVRGVPFGFNAPFRIYERVRGAVSVAGYLPDQFLARVYLVPATEPRWVLMDNRPHRLMLNLALSVSPVEWLSLGAGATVLADAAGNGITFNVGVKGGTKVGETAIDLELPVRIAPLAGALVKPLPWLRFGLFYRGEVDLRLALDILANVDVAGIVTGDAIITLRAVNYFTPHRLEAGVSVDPHPRLTLAAGVAWEMWSRFSGGVPDVRILVDLGLNPPMVQAYYPPDNFRDVVTPRLGAEYRHDLAEGHGLSARLGYVFAPTPVPDQVGFPALMDNTRHVFAAGLGYRCARVASFYPYPVGFDVGFQYHLLATRRVRRNLTADPVGGGLVSRGGLISVAASMKLEF